MPCSYWGSLCSTCSRSGVRTAVTARARKLATSSLRAVPARSFIPSGTPWSEYWLGSPAAFSGSVRSEEHTSELQSRENLVCRLLLEKKNDQNRHDREIT